MRNYTPEERKKKIETIIEFLEDGMFFVPACKLIGVSPDTVRKWLKKEQQVLGNTVLKLRLKNGELDYSDRNYSRRV